MTPSPRPPDWPKWRNTIPVSYPAPASWTDQLISKVSGNNYLDERLKALTGDYYECFSLLKTLDRQNCIQARVPFYISIR